MSYKKERFALGCVNRQDQLNALARGTGPYGEYTTDVRLEGQVKLSFIDDSGEVHEEYELIKNAIKPHMKDIPLVPIDGEDIFDFYMQIASYRETTIWWPWHSSSDLDGDLALYPNDFVELPSMHNGRGIDTETYYGRISYRGGARCYYGRQRQMMEEQGWGFDIQGRLIRHYNDLAAFNPKPVVDYTTDGFIRANRPLWDGTTHYDMEGGIITDALVPSTTLGSEAADIIAMENDMMFEMVDYTRYTSGQPIAAYNDPTKKIVITNNTQKIPYNLADGMEFKANNEKAAEEARLSSAAAMEAEITEEVNSRTQAFKDNYSEDPANQVPWYKNKVTLLLLGGAATTSSILTGLIKRKS